MTSRTGTGEEYNRKWGIGAKQARYHKDGHFYGLLERFPAALVILRAMSFSRQKKSINGRDPDYLALGEKNATSATGPLESPHSRLYQSRKMKLEF